MKLIIVIALVLSSLTAFAGDISCKGESEGYKVEYVIGHDDAGTINSIKTKINGKDYSNYTGAEVRVSEHVYGTMVAGEPANQIGVDGVLVLIDPKGGSLGWVSYYNRDFVLRGIKLDCNP